MDSSFDARTRPWYQLSVSNPNNVIWSEPYEDEATGEFVITASKAIEKNNKILGIVGIDIKLTTISQIVKDTNLGSNGEVFIVSNNKSEIIKPNLAKDETYIDTVFSKEEEVFIQDYSMGNKDMVMIVHNINKVNWKIGAIYEQADLLAAAEANEKSY